VCVWRYRDSVEIALLRRTSWPWNGGCCCHLWYVITQCLSVCDEWGLLSKFILLSQFWEVFWWNHSTYFSSFIVGDFCIISSVHLFFQPTTHLFSAVESTVLVYKWQNLWHQWLWFSCIMCTGEKIITLLLLCRVNTLFLTVFCSFFLLRKL